MTIKRVIQEVTWKIGLVNDDKVWAQGMVNNHLIPKEFSMEDFSPKDRSRLIDGNTFKEIEFYEDDENGDRNHVILITFKQETKDGKKN